MFDLVVNTEQWLQHMSCCSCERFGPFSLY